MNAREGTWCLKDERQQITQYSCLTPNLSLWHPTPSNFPIAPASLKERVASCFCSHPISRHHRGTTENLPTFNLALPKSSHLLILSGTESHVDIQEQDQAERQTKHRQGSMGWAYRPCGIPPVEEARTSRCMEFDRLRGLDVRHVVEL